MHSKSATTKYLQILLLSACVLTAALLSSADAQTVLSPTPLLPMQERVSPALDLMPPAPPPVDDQAADAADEKLFHISLMFNDSVESQIEYFTTRGRAVFQDWLNRSARYLPIMKKIFREYNLPEDLVYVAMIESGFNPKAVSQRKAVGPWQFMKATAREYGLSTDRWVDERRDPIKSTRAAAAHLKDLYNMFGSWPMALASYNAGRGRMQGAALKARSDDFWDLQSSRFIKGETQDYVPRYMAAMIIAKSPVEYGFTEPNEQAFEYDEIVVQNSTDLRRIASYAGSSFQEIQDLNPELLQSSTPHARYVLRLPPGAKKKYQEHIQSASAKGRQYSEERARARTPLLFTRLVPPKEPAKTGTRPAPVIISPYRAQLDLKNPLGDVLN